MWGSRAGGGAARRTEGVAIALASLAQPASFASPLAEGVGAVAPLERLLARPGPALRAAVPARNPAALGPSRRMIEAASRTIVRAP